MDLRMRARPGAAVALLAALFFGCDDGGAGAPDAAVDALPEDGAVEDMAPEDMAREDMAPEDMARDVGVDAMPDMTPDDMDAIDRAVDLDPIDMAVDAMVDMDPIDMAVDMDPIDMLVDLDPIDVAVDMDPIDVAVDMDPIDMAPLDMAEPPPDLIDTLTAAGRYATLLQALDAAGLTEALRAPGPLTLFAPDDAAFEALAAADPAALPALFGDLDALVGVLLYHVVDAEVTEADFAAGGALDTRAMRPALIGRQGPVGPAYVAGRRVVGAALRGANGVAWTVDGLLEPPAPCVDDACPDGLLCERDFCARGAPPGDLVATLIADGRFGRFVALLESARVARTLRAIEAATVFAPTDAAIEAFDAANPGALDALQADPAALSGVVRFHVVRGALRSGAVLASDLLVSLDHLPLPVDGALAVPRVAGAPIVDVDLVAGNGVIHALDGLLFPPGRSPNAGCGDAVVLGGPGFVVGDTRGAPDRNGPSCGGDGGPDAAFVFSPAADGPICALTRGSSFDTVLSARRDRCDAPAAEVACSDDDPIAGGASAVEFEGRAGSDYYLWVDGFADGIAGAFILELRAGPCAPRGDLVDVMAADGRFETLLDALEVAGLTERLRAPEPTTVFAPTDGAFEALAAADPGLLPALLADPEALAALLGYHVAPGRLSVERAVERGAVMTLDGRPLRVERRGDRALVNADTEVIAPDRAADNGWVHGIEAVLLPPTRCADAADCAPGEGCRPEEGVCLPAPLAGSIVDTLRDDGRFGTLLAALDAVGLTEALAGPGPLTLLAPTDAAFAGLGADALDALLADPAGLAEVLGFHVLPGALTGAQIRAADGQGVATLDGLVASVRDAGGALFVGRAAVEAVDRGAANGIVHVLGGVMRPIDACEGPTPIGAGEVIDGDTADAADRYAGPCALAPDGVEVAHVFTPVVAGPYCVRTAGSAFDTVLHVGPGVCGPSEDEALCSDDVDFGGDDLTSAVTLEAEAGVDYYLIVSGYDRAEQGAYRLSVAPGACAP